MNLLFIVPWYVYSLFTVKRLVALLHITQLIKKIIEKIIINVPIQHNYKYLVPIYV